MAIEGLRHGLEALGHRVDVHCPGSEGSGRPGLTVRRIAFNLGLPGRLPADRYDLVVGFDLDGFALPASPRPAGARPRRIACLKGVAADELRFESGATRARMSLLARLERRAARRADRVILPSRYSRRRAVALYGLDAGRTAVAPEGIHASRWSGTGPSSPPGPAGAGGPAPDDGGGARILSVARQYRRKATADLLRAMPAILGRRPGAHLVVIGGGPELPALRRLRSEAGLQGAVRLAGELASARAVRREYRRADVFCLPSLQEGFGIAFLEAMAAGLPVVACRAGAAPEVVEHGVTGLLCPPARPGALASAVERLVADPERRLAMGRSGRRKALRHDWRRVARIFLQRATAPSVRDGV